MGNSSKTVKLADHVGHTVLSRVRYGTRYARCKEKAKEVVDADAKEHGHLNATDIAMVSDSCRSNPPEQTKAGEERTSPVFPLCTTCFVGSLKHF